jgi:hypothetical protein
MICWHQHNLFVGGGIMDNPQLTLAELEKAYAEGEFKCIRDSELRLGKTIPRWCYGILYLYRGMRTTGFSRIESIFAVLRAIFIRKARPW